MHSKPSDYNSLLGRMISSILFGVTEGLPQKCIGPYDTSICLLFHMEPSNKFQQKKVIAYSIAFLVLQNISHYSPDGHCTAIHTLLCRVQEALPLGLAQKKYLQKRASKNRRIWAKIWTAPIQYLFPSCNWPLFKSV